jgi:hypothetical protein
VETSWKKFARFFQHVCSTSRFLWLLRRYEGFVLIVGIFSTAISYTVPRFLLQAGSSTTMITILISPPYH